MTRAIAAAGLLFLLSAAIPGGARSQDAGKPSSQEPDSSSTSSAPAAKPAKPKPKKVWTNDNVGDTGGTISVVGSASNGTAGGATAGGNNFKGQSKASTTKTAIDPKVVAQLRDQLQRLQSQLAIADRQLSDLKGASRGDAKSTGGVRQDTWSYDSSSVEEQIQHLQEKKKRIETTIEELFDAARKAGIEPGELR